MSAALRRNEQSGATSKAQHLNEYDLYGGKD